MKFSNDNATFANAVAFSNSAAWTLSSGDGTKTVYAKFKDSAGNWSSSYSDTISLDTASPLTSASPAGGIYNATQSVTLSCSDGTGSGCNNKYYCLGSGCSPTTSYSGAIGISNSTSLRFYSTDLAGNSETVKTETYTINIDTTGPTGSLSINGGSAFTNSTSATLSLTCSDTSGCSEMKLSNDGVFDTEIAEAYATSKSWTLSSGDGTKTVYAKFKDTAGNWSNAVSDTIVLDTTLPTGDTIWLFPKTGQTTCYDTSGNAISCAGTGQDGDIQAGATWPNPRFEDNGDQTVTDSLTGLMWTKDAGTPTAGSCTGGAMTWQGALDYVACLNTNNYLGHNDWRLPNRNELEGLVNKEQSNTTTWLNGLGFNNVQSGYYWSSSTHALYTGYAWFVHMWYGYVYGDNKTNSIYVWPVRSGDSGSFGDSVISVPKTGQTTCYDTSGNAISCAGTGQDGDIQAGATWPNPRFTDNGDQTVTDNLTGLMWTKDGGTPTAGSCTGGTKTWQGALDYAACLNTNNYLGHNDWRLPNRNELESLVNKGQANTFTWLNGLGFNNVQSIHYWSSSTYANLTGYAWGVYMWNGYVDVVNKTSNFYVWPVRAGDGGSFGNFGIAINGGAPYAISNSVTLTLSASDTSGVTEMKLSNDGVFDTEIAEAYATSKAWTLSSGDGTKTVYAKFKDTAGNWSSAYNDTITLDTALPDTNITAQPASLTNSASADFSFTSTEGGSTFECQLDAGGYSSCTSPKSYTGLSSVSHTFYVKATDTAGNADASPASYTWTVDTTVPNGDIFINGGATYTITNSVTLTLSASDANSVTEMKLSNDGVFDTEIAEAYSTSKSWTLISGNGTKTVYAKFKDSANNWSTAVSNTIILDTIAPSISINAVTTPATGNSQTITGTRENGATVTASTNTTATAGAVSYPAGTTWSLLISGLVEGGNNITATAADAAGNTANSTASITLDTTPPTGSVSINNSVSHTKSVVVTLNLTCTDASGCMEMQFSHDGLEWSAAEDYNATASWVLIPGDGTKTVYVQFKDGLNQWSSPYTDTIVLDTVIPTVSASPVTGTFKTSQNITLTVNETATVYYTTNGTTPTTASAVYAGPINIAATATLKFFAKDTAGNSSSVRTETYTIDGTVPTGSVSINSGAVDTASPTVTLTLTCNDAGTGCGQMRLSNDGVNWSPDEAYAASKTWALITGEGTKVVYAKFKDNAGNWSGFYFDTIELTTSAPETTASPSGGIYNSPQSVTLSCSDSAGCAGTYFTTDGSTPTQSTAYTAPISISVDTTLKFFSINNPGYEESVKTEVYKIDTAAPSSSIGNPLNGQTISQLTVIAGTASDDSSGVSMVDVQVTDGTHYLNSQQWFTTTPTWVAVGGTDSWSLNTGSVSWSAGQTYTIKVRVTDNAGRTSTTTSAFTYTAGGQAYTTLSLDLSSQTIKQGETINIAGKLTRPGAGVVDLSGLTINGTVTAPDNSQSSFVTTTSDASGFFIYNGIAGFAQKGAYSVQAYFEGTGSLYGSASETKYLLVGSKAGYAVIVEGKIAQNEGLDSHNKTANRIYKKLKERGFVDDDIYYYNYANGSSAGIANGVDASPSKAGVRSSIETWAKEKMNGSPAPLYVIMVDHGDQNAFYIGDETITPADLDGWFNTLEAGLNSQAIVEKRVIVIGACYSGSFINEVSGEGRIIVTSSAPDEKSYRGPMEPDGIKSGEYFLEEFFKELGKGYSINKSFKEATEKTELLTKKGGNSVNIDKRYMDGAVQHPLLDDDGDGMGSNILSEGSGDGIVTAGVYLGTGVTYTNSAENPAEVIDVTDTIYLDSLSSSALLWAKVNDDTQVDTAVWMEIRPPSMTLSSTAGTMQLDVDNDRVFMSPNASQWEATYNSFTESGMYEVFYFVRDIETGDISPMKRSMVYKNREGNGAPSSFSLVSPENGSEQKTVLLLDWQDSTDLDGDAVTFTVMISNSPAFETVEYSEDEIPHSVVGIELDAGLLDGTTYYWKALAVDAYGSIRASAETWSFTTNNPNSLPGIVEGYVYNSSTGAYVSGASVASGAGGSAVSQPGGYYFFMTQPGSVNVTASVDGYYSLTKAVTVSQGGSSTLNFAISPSTFTIAASSGAGGAITPSGNVSVSQGSTQAFTITPDSGYRVDKVLVDGSSVGAVTSYTFNNISSGHTIVVTFVREHEITATLRNEGGSISPSGIVKVRDGEDKTFNITTNVGFRIADVIVDGQSIGLVTAYAFYNVRSAHTIEVVFELLPDYSLSCTDSGTIMCIDRTDGGADGGNLDVLIGRPKVDVEYEFKVVVKDPGTPQSAKLNLAQRSNPVASDFHAYDMTCSGNYASGATCKLMTKLGPAAVHRFYFEAKMSNGATVKYPSSNYLTGPSIELVTGFNIVGAPRDFNSANLSGSTAFGGTKAYRWVSDNAYTHTGYYLPVTSGSPAVAGEGYFIVKENTVLANLDGYLDISGAEYSYQLQPGWNLISNPYAGNVKLSDIKVRKGSGTPITWIEAVSAGWLTNAIYYYNGDDWGATYSYESALGLPDATLIPWVGYWVQLNRTDEVYYLVIPKR